MEVTLQSPAIGDFSSDNTCTNQYPFLWEKYSENVEGKSTHNYEDDDIDFTFDFSGPLETPALSADELFYGGKIKPLEPPRHSPQRATLKCSFKRTITGTRRDSNLMEKRDQDGKHRVHDSSSSSQRGSKSLRAPNILVSKQANNERTCSKLSSSNLGSNWYGKWKLRDLMFRNSSEGHARNKKYDILRKNKNEDVKISRNFRSHDRKKERVSAHEWHYKMNRAAADEPRRKTFLPYKQNLMGCMDLNAVVREPSCGRIRRI